VRVLFDTNVLMDVLLDRQPFVETSAQLLDQVVRGTITGLIGATTVTTIFYLASREIGKKDAKRQIEKLMALFEIAPVTRSVLEAAMTSRSPDYEDAVLAEAAHQAGAQAIVTRNLKDFAHSPVRAYTPKQWLAMATSPTRT
jgi:predicted nucleic acid-binding protein